MAERRGSSLTPMAQNHGWATIGVLLRKIIPVVAAGATALALAGGTFSYATLNKDVTLSVDGQPTTVSTMAGNFAFRLRIRMKA